MSGFIQKQNLRQKIPNQTWPSTQRKSTLSGNAGLLKSAGSKPTQSQFMQKINSPVNSCADQAAASVRSGPIGTHTLMRKAASILGPAGGQAPISVKRGIRQASATGMPLHQGLRNYMKRAPSADFSQQRDSPRTPQHTIQRVLDYDAKQLDTDDNDEGGFREEILDLLMEYDSNDDAGIKLDIVEEINIAIGNWENWAKGKNIDQTTVTAIKKLQEEVYKELLPGRQKRMADAEESYYVDNPLWEQVLENTQTSAKQWQTRYRGFSKVADYPHGGLGAEGTREKVQSLKGQKQQYNKEEQKILKKHETTLKKDTDFYRWGEYQFEKRYVQNNGFDLGAVNFGAKQYGPGLYVANSPWGSSQYAKSKNGCIIKVTVPRDTPIVDCTRVGGVLEQKIYNSNSLRSPAMIHVGAGWYAIRDDGLKLQIDFYQPPKKSYKKIKSHYLASGKNAEEYMALQIIDKQIKPANLPDKKLLDQQMEKMKAGVFTVKRLIEQQRLMRYVDRLSENQYVPFLLSRDRLDFGDDVKESVDNLISKKLFAKNPFKTIFEIIKTWAGKPFSMDYEDFNNKVVTPFKKQLGEYKDGKSQKNEKKMKGNEDRLTTFLSRLYGFSEFLYQVDKAVLTEKDWNKELELHNINISRELEPKSPGPWQGPPPKK